MEVENWQAIQEEENKKNSSEPKKTPPKYDPKKMYRWEKDSAFYMSGEEFGSILNAVRATLSSPEAQRIIMLEKAGLSLENVISRAVELGIAKEDPTPIKRN